MVILKLTKIPKLNLLIIKQAGGKFFLASQDSIIIDEEGIYTLLETLLDNNMLNAEIVEDIGFARKVRSINDTLQKDTVHSD